MATRFPRTDPSRLTAENSGRGGKVSAVNVRKSLNLREGEALNKARMLGHTLCDKAVKTIGKLH